MCRSTYSYSSLVPRPPSPAFVTWSTKSTDFVLQATKAAVEAWERGYSYSTTSLFWTPWDNQNVVASDYESAVWDMQSVPGGGGGGGGVGQDHVLSFCMT